MARVLAIDHGDSKIGLAIGDTKEQVIAPYEVLSSDAFEDIYQQLQMIIDQNKIEEIVVGYPLNLKGEKTEQTKKVEAFTEELSRRTTIPIIFEDERLTTVQAQRQNRGLFAKLWYGSKKDNIQKASAVLILETYLEKKKKEAEE